LRREKENNKKRDMTTPITKSAERANSALQEVKTFIIAIDSHYLLKKRAKKRNPGAPNTLWALCGCYFLQMYSPNNPPCPYQSPSAIAPSPSPLSSSSLARGLDLSLPMQPKQMK
jgi:hypothetical protein